MLRTYRFRWEPMCTSADSWSRAFYLDVPSLNQETAMTMHHAFLISTAYDGQQYKGVSVKTTRMVQEDVWEKLK
jgi:hypothetical protein